MKTKKERKTVGRMVSACFGIVILSVLCGTGLAGAQQVFQDLQPGGMWDHAVADFGDVLRGSEEKNLQLRGRNKALEQRIQRLEAEKDELLQRQEDLAEETGALVASVELLKQERQGIQGRLDGLGDWEQKWQAEQKTWQEKILLEEGRQARYEKEVGLLKEEVALFRRKARKDSVPGLLRDKQQEQSDLQKDLKDKRKVLKKKRRELDRLQERLSGMKAAQGTLRGQVEEAQARQQRYRAELARKDKDLQALLEQKTANTEYSAQRRQLEEDVRSLRAYQDVLERTISDIQAEQRQLIDESRRQEVQLQRWQEWLVMEQNLLSEQIKQLRFKPEAPLPEPGREEVLLAKREELSFYRQQEEQLQEEILGLNEQLVSLEEPAADDITERLSEILEQVDPEDEPAVVMGSPLDSEEPDSVLSEDVLKEIQVLTLREEVLSGSFSIISRRYQQEKADADRFLAEESQLEEYRRILEKENRGLQEKILKLQMSLGK